MRLKSVYAVALLLALTGCVPAILGGGFYAMSSATSERGIGGAVSDVQIKAGINKKWFDADGDISKRLSMTVNEGRVLITGQARDQAQKMEASRLAWEVEGVQEVINEAKVIGSETIASYAHDTWISTKLRTFLTFDSEVAGRNYTIDTMGGVVYLMGAARTQAELDRVTEHARTISGVQKVISYVRVK